MVPPCHYVPRTTCGICWTQYQPIPRQKWLRHLTTAPPTQTALTYNMLTRMLFQCRLRHRRGDIYTGNGVSKGIGYTTSIQHYFNPDRKSTRLNSTHLV